MALEVDLVPPVRMILPLEEMIEGDLVQSGGRGIGRNVPADPALVAVGAHDHRHRVPADDALDAALDLALSGKTRLVGTTDRVEVRRVGGIRQRDAELGRATLQGSQQLAYAVLAPSFDDVVERLEPLLLFECVELALLGVLQALGHICSFLF